MIKVNPLKWEYLKESALKRKRKKICITCNHFLYSTTETFAIVLICPRYEKRKAQGDHLLKGCEYLQKNRMIFLQKHLNYFLIKPLLVDIFNYVNKALVYTTKKILFK